MIARALEPGDGRVAMFRKAIAIAQAQRRLVHHARIATFDFLDPGDLRFQSVLRIAEFFTRSKIANLALPVFSNMPH